MDAVSNNLTSMLDIYAMKKAIQVQEAGVLKILESLQAPEAETFPSLGLTQEGIGSLLDIKG